MAPLEHHIKVYIAVVGGDPSKLQSPPSEGWLCLINPLVTLTQVGGLHITSRQSLCNLADQELHQLMEDLCQEIALCELHAPPAILNQHLGENHQGAGIIMRMTRRSPFQEGEGGFPQDNHPHLQPQHDQMEDGLLRDHLLNSKACSTKSRHGAPDQHVGIGIRLGYPKNKHLQW